MIKNKILREVHDEMLRETHRLQQEQDEKYNEFASRNRKAFEEAESSRDFIIKHFDESLKNVADTLNVSISALKDDVKEVKDEIKKHSDSIDSINKDKIRMEDDIKHLSEKIDKQEASTNKRMGWLIGLVGTVLGGMTLFFLQHLLSIPGLFQ